jgi:hypothetical protein
LKPFETTAHWHALFFKKAFEISRNKGVVACAAYIMVTIDEGVGVSNA